jgi:hypothetical protein
MDRAAIHGNGMPVTGFDATGEEIAHAITTNQPPIIS